MKIKKLNPINTGSYAGMLIPKIKEECVVLDAIDIGKTDWQSFHFPMLELYERLFKEVKETSQYKKWLIKSGSKYKLKL